MKQTRFVDPRALAAKHRKDLVDRQTDAINSASRPIIEILPDDYDEHEEEKKSKAKRHRDERDEDMEELLAIIQETGAVGEQEIGMMLIEYPAEEDDTKKANDDDIDALFEADAESEKQQTFVPGHSRGSEDNRRPVDNAQTLVPLPSRLSDIGPGAKSREEIRLERLQALKEERERENEQRRNSIRMRRPDLVDEKALHRKEAYYQHNWLTDRKRQNPPANRPKQPMQIRRVVPVKERQQPRRKRPAKKKQRSSRNYRNQHWDNYGNWHDPDNDNFWKSGNDADRK